MSNLVSIRSQLHLAIQHYQTNSMLNPVCISQPWQALYYWLRTYLLERRDVAGKSEMLRGAPNRSQAQMASSTVSNFANSSDVAASPASNSTDTSPGNQMPLSNSGNQVIILF